jgi:uncharacterized membrane protein YedE/YeeE
MTIDWTNFTPGLSLLGGVLIGIASALFILANGRIAGISGILGGLLRPRRDDIVWRLAFLLGLIVAPVVLFAFMPPVSVTIDAGSGVLIAAGLLVGIGTRYGAGCTSGHGVCGLSRLSPRSLVATMAFMAAGMAIVFVMRHLLA